MNKVFSSTFGGLDKKYLAKQYIVGMLICFFYSSIVSKYGQGLGIFPTITFIVNTILYPY